ncbi:hypothetical protein [Erythrobacter crassostreae]|uniref:Uncharacterized protein n=1 Tax=Erythrobacter crassostreae TaxID=2828328 RepID=A0A9X1JK94_9SPHN|nr:hypothetical protein [Erythrobacter crassostrea]MBV7258775.1 hypothetical protein [Erythrobacter crassostrea]
MNAAPSHCRQPPGWRRSTCALLASACVVLSACDNSGGTAPGAVSEGEARALEEAAEMLDERRLPEGVVPDPDAPATMDPADGENAEASGVSEE